MNWRAFASQASIEMLSNEPLVGMEGEKQVPIEERMKLSSSRMCSQKQSSKFSETEFQVLRNRVLSCPHIPKNPYLEEHAFQEKGHFLTSTFWLCPPG